MGQKLDSKETIILKGLLITNSISIDVLCQLSRGKGFITEGEYLTKIQYVQAECRARQNDP